MRALFPRGVLIIAAVSFALWMLVAHRYGFHRDELYFIEGGHHPAWAQPDNPILVPLLAAGWHGLVGGNLTLFRVLPALAGVATILLASLTAREISGSRRAQVVTAFMVAGSSFPLAVAHLFSISTFDLALTTLVLLLLIRAIGRPPRWAPGSRRAGRRDRVGGQGATRPGAGQLPARCARGRAGVECCACRDLAGRCDRVAGGGAQSDLAGQEFLADVEVARNIAGGGSTSSPIG